MFVLVAANGSGFAKCRGDVLSLAWPLKTRLVKAKLLKPSQKSNSLWVKYKNQTFVLAMLAAVICEPNYNALNPTSVVVFLKLINIKSFTQ